MKEAIKNRIEKLLAKEYWCSPKKLNETGVVYSINTSAQLPYVKIMAYKNCIVVCTSEELHEKMQRLLQNKNRDEIFELPFVYGQTIHYVPGNGCAQRGVFSSEYTYQFLLEEDVLSLRGLTGFENSLVFDEDGAASAKAVCVAVDAGRVIAVAGAAETSTDHVWEVGVDVKEGYRNKGLATVLVSRLTEKLLAKEIVPFYSASVTNLGSQMVACRCGYQPMWVDTFGTVLDGSSVYDDIVKTLSFGADNFNSSLRTGLQSPPAPETRPLHRSDLQ